MDRQKQFGGPFFKFDTRREVDVPLLDSSSDLKTCSKCQVSYPPEMFAVDNHSKDGLSGWCKSCKRNQRRMNPEIRKARFYHVKAQRESYNDGTVTPNALRTLYSLWDGICPLCKEVAAPTIDHVIPLSKGGPNSMKNIRLICASCNSQKGAK